jgi:uncharacterized protein HemX
MAQKKVDFGAFLAGLATQAGAATQETLTKLQEKMEAEKQARLENKLRRVFEEMEHSVSRLREIRRQEKSLQAHIAELQEKANKIVAGTDED